MDLQRYSDTFLAKTLLPFIPRRVTPNQVSWLRILSLPFICYLLWRAEYVAGLILFSVAALTDAIDGAMARTRDQITETGKILDAVADRCLMLLVALFFIPRYFGWKLLVFMALIELLNAFMGYRSRKRIGVNPGANWAGKTKMILQSVAFILLFLMLVTGETAFLKPIALFVFGVSLLFNLVQCFLYPERGSALFRSTEAVSELG